MEYSKNEIKQKLVEHKFNRALYFSFTIISLYYFAFSTDKIQGVACLGIALAFDPFNPKQPFNLRPLYQKVWLLIHVLLVLILFIVNTLHINVF